MTDLTEDELRVLMDIAAGHTLFTEYQPESDWKAAAALDKKGLITGKGLLTGSARFSLTDAGRALLAAPRTP